MAQIYYVGEPVAVAANGDLPFNRYSACCDCNERYEGNTNTLTLTTPGRYLITATVNASFPSGATVTPISVALTANGSVIAGTTGTATPNQTVAAQNIAVQTEIDVYKCCCKTISLRNVGAAAQFDNQNLIARKIGGGCYA